MTALGQFITDRWMVGILRELASKQGIAYETYSDDWILEFASAGKTARVYGYKFPVNTATASAIASDKVAAYQILMRSGIPAVPHTLLRSKAGPAAQQTEQLDYPLVLKPLDGTSGHGVRTVTSQNEYNTYIAAHPTVTGWCTAPLLNIEQEQRLIMLDGVVLLAFTKKPVIRHGMQMHNLGLGARATVHDPIESDVALAAQAMQSLDLRLAAVDIITVGGQQLILEVNDGIMLENFMRQTDQYKGLATGVYGHILTAMLR